MAFVEESCVVPRTLFPTTEPEVSTITIQDSPVKPISPPRDVHNKTDCAECQGQGVSVLGLGQLRPLDLDLERLAREGNFPPILAEPVSSSPIKSKAKARGRPAADYKTLWTRERWRANEVIPWVYVLRQLWTLCAFLLIAEFRLLDVSSKGQFILSCGM